MRRPVAKSLLIGLGDLYEFYVRLEWAACEWEAQLDDLPREELERRVWRTSQLRRMAFTFFGCFGAFTWTDDEADRPGKARPNEWSAASYSAYLEQQAAFWSEQAKQSEARARESAVRRAEIAGASASFHRLLGHPPEVVRERAKELDVDPDSFFAGWKWEAALGLVSSGRYGRYSADDAALLARLDPASQSSKGGR